MRFMMIVKGNENIDRAGPPPASLMEAIDDLTQEYTKNGKLVSFGGLYATADGFRVRSANGKLTKTDGPFTEAKEVIGGFSILDLASKDEAVAEAMKFMELHQRHWPEWEGETEVRRMFQEGEEAPWDQPASEANGTKGAS